ncbi:MAG: YebC/PmpR family DNA-binding transcriptional regulator, partial [Erysipelotrichaceae bacterium]
DEEAMMEALIEADVNLLEIEVEDGTMNINVEPSDLHKAKLAIEALIPDVKFLALEPTMIPNEYVELEGDEKMLFERLVTLLDDVDDVQNIYHNVANLD